MYDSKPCIRNSSEILPKQSPGCPECAPGQIERDPELWLSVSKPWQHANVKCEKRICVIYQSFDSPHKVNPSVPIYNEYIKNIYTGWWLTYPLKNDGVRQIGSSSQPLGPLGKIQSSIKFMFQTTNLWKISPYLPMNQSNEYPWYPLVKWPAGTLKPWSSAASHQSRDCARASSSALPHQEYLRKWFRKRMFTWGCSMMFIA